MKTGKEYDFETKSPEILGLIHVNMRLMSISTGEIVQGSEEIIDNTIAHILASYPETSIESDGYKYTWLQFSKAGSSDILSIPTDWIIDGSLVESDNGNMRIVTDLISAKKRAAISSYLNKIGVSYKISAEE